MSSVFVRRFLFSDILSSIVSRITEESAALTMPFFIAAFLSTGIVSFLDAKKLYFFPFSAAIFASGLEIRSITSFKGTCLLSLSTICTTSFVP